MRIFDILGGIWQYPVFNVSTFRNNRFADVSTFYNLIDVDTQSESERCGRINKCKVLYEFI